MKGESQRLNFGDSIEEEKRGRAVATARLSRHHLT
jgi:hypothetical protein